VSLRKVQSGDPLRIPAATFNTFIDAARDFQQRTRQMGQKDRPSARHSGIIHVRNDSGTDRSRFEVLSTSSAKKVEYLYSWDGLLEGEELLSPGGQWVL
jgi:hypothetical protein